MYSYIYCISCVSARTLYLVVFFFNYTATTEIYTYVHTLSLHDALPICYTAAADIYLGDTSSQVVELLMQPRPCVFLAPLGVDWHDDPSYAMWAAGEVEIGSASCRERVCEYGSLSVVAVSLKHKRMLLVRYTYLPLTAQLTTELIRLTQSYRHDATTVVE